MNTTNGGMELAPAVHPTYEVIHLEQTRHVCPMCEDYAAATRLQACCGLVL